MGDIDLSKLLEPHAKELKSIADAAVKGERDKVIDGAAGLAITLATGNPALGVLAPLARKGIAKAFGNAADEMFARELAKMEKDEERAAFIGQIEGVMAALFGQTLIQLVRNQHNVKDEVLDALGDIREDFVQFRKDFEKSLKERGEGQAPNANRDARTELREMLHHLNATVTPFTSQNQRMRELVDQIVKRLEIRDSFEFEEFFAGFYNDMNDRERFAFSQIRATTELLYEKNASVLAILERSTHLPAIIPELTALRDHLNFWCNKFQRVFKNTPSMCVVYVGVEDRLPFPRGIERKIQQWLEANP